MSFSSPISIALSFFLVFVIYRTWSRQSGSLPLPPGPPPKLISGNLHQLQRVEPWVGYMKWAEKYGPILHFRIFTRRFIVLNSAKTVTDLLEARSNIYSDRPILWMYNELVGRKWAIFNISSLHPWFRKYRTLLRSALYTNGMEERYQELQGRYSLVLLDLLNKEPAKFIDHARRNAGSIILELAYGWQVTGEDDYLVSLMKESFALAGELTAAGRWLVDTFPWMRFIPSWFPGGGFHNKAREYREKMAPIDQFPHAWVKKQMESGSYIPSFTSMHLQEDNLSEEEEDIVRWTAAGLYAGGADTTVSAMTSFFLVMALYPEVQKRAQEEIDQFIGQDVLPHVKDRGQLIYVEAVLKEIMRWAPVVPLGLPHRVTQTDEYMGYKIPGGVTVFANIWAIMHDPEVYMDPYSFTPTRFLPNKDGRLPETDPLKYAFGFGRRVCPGAQFAEDSLFINIARILATFDIRKAIGDDGKEIEPTIEFTSGVIRHAKPFPCRFILREGSAGARVLSDMSS
ncbi:cytochrome P450 [Marasmius fiardii PR-910]|nr:cytochrome P450 [Marasmius fiardii PR-910]